MTSSPIFLKFLKTLQYPFTESFSLPSRVELIRLVSWLEDRKIRALEIDERDALRVNSELWSSSFRNYLNQLACPYKWDDTEATVDTIDSNFDCIFWLVSYAINMEFEDIAEEVVDIERRMDVPTSLVEEQDISVAMIEDDHDPTTDLATVKHNSDDDTAKNTLLSSDIESLGEKLKIARLVDESDSDYFQRLGYHIHLYYSSSSKAAYDNCISVGHSDDESNAHNVDWTGFPLGFDTSGKFIIYLFAYLS